MEVEQILRNLIKELEAQEDYISSIKPMKLVTSIFAKNEAQAWRENEVDFTKRIVTPLKGTGHQTRRYQNLLAGSFASAFDRARFWGSYRSFGHFSENQKSFFGG